MVVHYLANRARFSLKLPKGARGEKKLYIQALLIYRSFLRLLGSVQARSFVRLANLKCSIARPFGVLEVLLMTYKWRIKVKGGYQTMPHCFVGNPSNRIFLVYTTHGLGIRDLQPRVFDTWKQTRPIFFCHLPRPNKESTLSMINGCQLHGSLMRFWLFFCLIVQWSRRFPKKLARWPCIYRTVIEQEILKLPCATKNGRHRSFSRAFFKR